MFRKNSDEPLRFFRTKEEVERDRKEGPMLIITRKAAILLVPVFVLFTIAALLSHESVGSTIFLVGFVWFVYLLCVGLIAVLENMNKDTYY